ncbi:hypothetical protein WN943_005342 [Citrus x changshan-huyou]
MDSQNTSFQAGQTKGQAQEKGSQMMDKASNAVHSVQDSCNQAGQQVKAQAESAADAVKSTVGANK